MREGQVMLVDVFQWRTSMCLCAHKKKTMLKRMMVVEQRDTSGEAVEAHWSDAYITINQFRLI